MHYRGSFEEMEIHFPISLPKLNVNVRVWEKLLNSEDHSKKSENNSWKSAFLVVCLFVCLFVCCLLFLFLFSEEL